MLSTHKHGEKWKFSTKPKVAYAQERANRYKDMPGPGKYDGYKLESIERDKGQSSVIYKPMRSRL